MKKTKLETVLDNETDSLRRQGKQTVKKLVKNTMYLEKCVNDDIYPIWLTDVRDNVIELLAIAQQLAVLQKVKHTKR